MMMKRFELLVATVVICAALASMTSTVQAQGLFDKLRDAAESMEQISRTLQDITGATGGQTAREEEPEPVTERRTEAKNEPKQTGPQQTRQEWKDIQARLNALGYNAGPVDGIPGRGTRSAIAAFEKANDLDSDGKADSVMLQALFSRNARAMPRVASEPSEPVTKPTKGSAATSTVAENASSPGTATETTGVSEDDTHNRTSLQIDCENWNTYEFFKTATLADVQHCLGAGHAVDRKDEHGLSPLLRAVAVATPEVVTAMLDASDGGGVDDSHGGTLLHYAAVNPSPKVLAIVLAADVQAPDIESTDDAGWTPLHRAARWGYPEVVTALLDAGASIQARTIYSDRTPYALAEKNKKGLKGTEAHRRLQSGSADATGTAEVTEETSHTPAKVQADCEKWLHGSFYETATATDVQHCLDAGAGIRQYGADRLTPLHWAAWVGTAEVVATLIHAGANIEAVATSAFHYLPHEWTPLHYAALKNSADVVTALVEGGANIEAKATTGSTPLHLAALKNNADIVTTLIDSGATIEAKNRHGRTPLHFAARRNTAEVVTVLLDAGANVKVQDNEGMTALGFAEKDNSALKGTDAYQRLR